MVDGTVTETPDQSLRSRGFGQLRPRGWRWLRLLFSAIWLVYLAQPLSTLSGREHSVLFQVAAVVVALAFCAVFIVAVIQWDEHPALARWAVWLLFPLAAAFNLMFHGVNVGGGVVWIYVSSAVGWAVPDRRWAVRAVFGVAACYLFFGWLGHDDISDMLITLIPVVFVGITMSGFRVQMKLMWELRQAREEVAKHAASEERLRLARDMHDLTGQSLSMITLKSELAARLLERLPEGPDRDRVADEIQQVAAVSRQTLHDIRDAISGYRRPTLAVETITARTALESAGIAPHDDPELTLLSGTFNPDAEAALAWCLREAVTNVIRHSGAKNCFIRLSRHDETQTLSLQVRDDGRGCPGGEAADRGPGPAEIAGRYRHRPARDVRAAVRGRRRPGAAPGRARLLPRRDGADGSRGFRRRGRYRNHVTPIRVLIAEDQEMIREALAALLSFEDDIEVVAQVGRGDEVTPAALASKPDVALLDIEMPGMDGLTAAAALSQASPGTKIVILTTFGRPGYLRRAMEAGASGFVVKDSPADRLARTIRQVLSGQRVIDPELAAAALAEGASPLTPRERDVLAASQDGATIAEIAVALYLSEGTVRNYLSACIQKTGARNRTEALRVAEERGWL